MQEVHDLGQGFLGLVLPRHVGKGFAGLAFHVNLRVGFAKLHSVAAHALCHHPPQQLADHHKEQDREHPRHQEAQQRAILCGDGRGKLRAGLVQPIYQTVVRHAPGLVKRGLAVRVLGGKKDLILFQGYLSDFLPLDHAHKIVVAHLRHRGGEQQRKDQRVQKHDHNHGDQVIKYQRFFRGLIVYLHRAASFSPVHRASQARCMSLFAFAYGFSCRHCIYS